MMRNELFAAVDRYFDGERAASIAAELTQFYRTPGSSGSLEAIAVLQSAFRDAGFDDLEVNDYPVDDSWEPRSASLSMVGESGDSTLVDYESAPPCLAPWSRATSADGEVLEVIDVGTGESTDHFEGAGVAGKAVFIHGTTRRPAWWEAARLAVQYGARGIITDYMLYQIPGIREPHLVPDAVQLLRLPMKDADAWAFSISHRAAENLKSRLRRGKVEVRAKVDIVRREGVLRNLVATIEGSELPEESILYCAHSSGVKPGANCAEGPGMLVELARALRDAIEAGDLSRPKRTLRFLIGAEGAGIARYIQDNPEEVSGTSVAFTFCSPGHRQDLTRANLMLYNSPDSVPGYINDYLAELIDLSPKEADWIEKDGGAELDQIRVAQHFYTPWSDNGRFAAEGIQAPLFMSWPDRYFHSQLLTPEVIDPVVLRRCSLVVGVAGLELASAGEAEAIRIAMVVAGNARRRLSALASGIEIPGMDSGDMLRRAIARTLDLSRAALRRTLELVPSERREHAERAIAEFELQLAADADRELASLAESPQEDKPSDDAFLVPVKVGTGRAPRWAGLNYSDLLEAADAFRSEDPSAGFNCLRVVADELWANVDGSTTVGDISLNVGLEFRLRLAINGIMILLRGLEEAGYVNLRSGPVEGTNTKEE